MSTIEQASKRLEQLKQAGVEVPWSGQPQSGFPGGAQPVALAGPLQDLASRPRPLAEPLHRVDIPLAALAGEGYLVPGAARSRLMDEFRAIKRPLLANAVGDKTHEPVAGGNVIMITSSLPGEGKTFLSINLAMSLAMSPHLRVLLIDADPTRREATQRLGIGVERPGLIDLLCDPELDSAEVELATNVERLSFIPAGATHQLATELFGGQEMRELLDRLAADPAQRIVIIDAPPLLHAAEARALAPQMGQIILAVQAGSTPRGSVLQALSLLEECPVVMTVLNQARAPSPSSSYGYYAY